MLAMFEMLLPEVNRKEKKSRTNGYVKSLWLAMKEWDEVVRL